MSKPINSIKRHCHIYFTLFLDTFYIYLCWRDHPCKILNFWTSYLKSVTDVFHKCGSTGYPLSYYVSTATRHWIRSSIEHIGGVVQLNSQTNASFTKTMSLCFCHLLAQEWSKSVSFPNAMVQLVLMGGGVMASSLVPAETSFYIQA